MAADSHFGCPNITSYHCTIFIFVNYFHKMATSAHFGCPKFTFDHISGHFRSIRNFFCCWNFDKMCRRPFWMSEINFRSHFWPFQIDTDFFLKLITKWLPSAILDVRNSLSIAFLAISDRLAILDVWNSLSIAILAISYRSAIFDVRNSLSMAFLAISDPYGTWFCLNVWQNGRRRPFWMSENNFRSHFWPF